MGIPLQEITEAEAKEIESRVKTWGRALYYPTTATVNPTHVVNAMVNDAKNEGVDIHYDSGYQSRQGAVVQSSQNSYEAGYIVNAAGLHADHIARDFGFSEHYRTSHLRDCISIPMNRLEPYVPTSIPSLIYGIPS